MGRKNSEIGNKISKIYLADSIRCSTSGLQLPGNGQSLYQRSNFYSDDNQCVTIKNGQMSKNRLISGGCTPPRRLALRKIHGDALYLPPLQKLLPLYK